MKEYCFTVQRVRIQEEKVIVEADSLKAAEDILQAHIDSGHINWEEVFYDTDEETFEIDGESCNEDMTFDSEQFSDYGVQRFL